MGVTVSDIGYGLDFQVGEAKPEITVSRSRGSSALHEPTALGDADDDWDAYLDTLTAAKTSKAAFVSAFTTAWGPGAAAVIASWTTAEQDALVALAAKWAAKLGV